MFLTKLRQTPGILGYLGSDPGVCWNFLRMLHVSFSRLLPVASIAGEPSPVNHRIPWRHKLNLNFRLNVTKAGSSSLKHQFAFYMFHLYNSYKHLYINDLDWFAMASKGNNITIGLLKDVRLNHNPTTQRWYFAHRRPGGLSLSQGGHLTLLCYVGRGYYMFNSCFKGSLLLVGTVIYNHPIGNNI